MPPPRSDFDRELQALETELRRLEAEYNMFFAGRLPKLPWDQRSRVDTLMKRYDRMHIQNTGDRFRFQTIQSRWAAFCELWERQLKNQEQGRRARMRTAAAPAPAAAAPATAPFEATARVKDHVVAVTSVSNPDMQQDRVQSLYQQLADARREAGEKPVEYERFTELVKAQISKLGDGGREVAFRVAVKDGKVTLTAKTVGEP
jgi:hypothetical protein